MYRSGGGTAGERKMYGEIRERRVSLALGHLYVCKTRAGRSISVTQTPQSCCQSRICDRPLASCCSASKVKGDRPSVNCQLLDQHRCRGSYVRGRRGLREQTNRTNTTLRTCTVTFHSQKMMQQHREGRGRGEEELLQRKRANHCAAPLLWCGHQGEGHRVNHGSVLNLHLHPPLYQTTMAAVFFANLHVKHAGGKKLQRAARLRRSAANKGCGLDGATATRDELVCSGAEQPALQCRTPTLIKTGSRRRTELNDCRPR